GRYSCTITAGGAMTGVGTTTGGGRTSARGTGGANTPKMPVPAIIWLKTAKAPRPRAASVEAPANAAPGMSSAIKLARTIAFFMSVPPEGANLFAFPLVRRTDPRREVFSRADGPYPAQRQAAG